MGYEGPLANPGDDEGPVRQVSVAAFEIAPTTVTNAQFAQFVAATGHVTTAERDGWSFVFHALVSDPAAVTATVAGTPWWCRVEAAAWWAPYGPGSSAGDLGDHPVVHVSAHDAEAYCAWTGTRLPSEQEWERAARGGLDGALYPWGDEPPEGRCNTFEGAFPWSSSGGVGTRPVSDFAPNGFGLHQCAGNVWEWTSSTWRERRVRRGGSYLCHDSYCNRYRVAARDSSLPGDATGNLGFRVCR